MDDTLPEDLLRREQWFYDQAGIELESGNRPAALDLLERLVAAGSVRADIHNDLGILVQEAGEVERAIAIFRNAAALEPSGTHALRNLAAAYLATGRIGEALATLSLVIRREGPSAEINEIIASILAELGPQPGEIDWLSPAIGELREAATRLHEQTMRQAAELRTLEKKVATQQLAAQRGPSTAEYCASIASLYGVSPQVHDEDFIFRFFVNHPGFAGNPYEAVRRYFDSGAVSTANLRSIVFDRLKFPRTSPARLLEFASGYGCVTRHLDRFRTDFDVVACDIHGAATDFIERRLGARTLLSKTVPEEVAAVAEYDVVFALSFFSHMPERTWTRWLRRLLDFVPAGGYVVFTTHGFASLPQLGKPEVPASGIWFKPMSEQGDLDAADYGTTMTTPGFVMRQIENLPCRLALFEHGYWWGHQDVWAIRKTESDGS